MRIPLRLSDKSHIGDIHVLVRYLLTPLRLDTTGLTRSQNQTGGYHTIFWGVKQSPQMKQTPKRLIFPPNSRPVIRPLTDASACAEVALVRQIGMVRLTPSGGPRCKNP